jgi:hypothetical protein
MDAWQEVATRHALTIMRLRTALEFIAEHRGKCLLGPVDGDSVDRPYERGSCEAFGQMAEAARNALAETSLVQTETTG